MSLFESLLTFRYLVLCPGSLLAGKLATAMCCCDNNHLLRVLAPTNVLTKVTNCNLCKKCPEIHVLLLNLPNNCMNKHDQTMGINMLMEID